MEAWYASLPHLNIKPLFENFSTLKLEDPTKYTVPVEKDGVLYSLAECYEIPCIYSGKLVTKPVRVLPWFGWNPVTNEGYIKFFANELSGVIAVDLFNKGWERNASVIYRSHFSWNEEIAIDSPRVPSDFIITFNSAYPCPPLNR